ncbi:hypothetical protein P171DRAFT_453150 [Karstenula rhodostoma CBS 690.94]|uniref:PRISE-like Rossmann-fold domain-containing protein n=1 Tax=Karstenula rhodostoma CBS 690.94 TaxID=1392251 RepID=A0A9P4PQ22_9PLEO|nr:hypothetical protein P171DRAFT_453150 [Karstenula rhodostoma CBS 690.94]
MVVFSRSPFKTTVHDDRFTFIALDLSNDPDSLIKDMRTLCNDFKELNIANEKLFSNFSDALLAVAPRLENCTLQTGGRHSKVHLGPVNSPACEKDPKRESPIGNFYYPQEDYLICCQKGQRWTWNVVRPEAIIGHNSKPNGMNSALTYLLYLLVCKELGSEARMPTNQLYWEGYDELSDSKLIADLTIWASTSYKAGKEALNAADKQEVWNQIYEEILCPEANSTWESGTWAFQDWVFQRTWSATLSINKAR